MPTESESQAAGIPVGLGVLRVKRLLPEASKRPLPISFISGSARHAGFRGAVKDNPMVGTDGQFILSR